jgi:hypothetical protein
LALFFGFSGTATKWNDYRRLDGDVPNSVTFPAGASSTTLTLYPVADAEVEDTETVLLTLTPDAGYNIGTPGSATITLADRVRVLSVVAAADGANVLTWTTAPGYLYQVLSKDDLSDPGWTDLSGNIFATGETTSWMDAAAAAAPQRQYLIGVAIPDDTRIQSLTRNPEGWVTLTWSSVPGDIYRVLGKDHLDDSNWTELSGSLTAGSATTRWTDPTAAQAPQRFYLVSVQSVDRVGIAAIVPIHGGGMLLTWTSEPDRIYRVVSKDSWPGGNWTDLSGDIAATGTTTSWPDYSAADAAQRFYAVRVAE